MEGGCGWKSPFTGIVSLEQCVTLAPSHDLVLLPRYQHLSVSAAASASCVPHMNISVAASASYIPHMSISAVAFPANG